MFDLVHHLRPQPPGDIPDGEAAAWGAGLPWCTPHGVRLPGREAADESSGRVVSE